MSVAAVLAVVAVLGLVGFRTWLGERPVHDPRYLEFEASRDHDAVNEKGVPLVQRYVLELYRPGAAEPVERIDLGKPSPSAAGVIQIDFSSIRKPSVASDTYEVAITAVGPYGKSGSNRSSRFTLSSR